LIGECTISVEREEKAEAPPPSAPPPGAEKL